LYRKIDHVGIAVRSIEEALRVYAVLGFQVDHIEEVGEQKTRVAMLPIGESRLELLESTEPDSPIARFISKRGEGLHHITFRVDDIFEELSRLRAAGIRLIDEVPRTGADRCLVAFIHPSSTGGVLVELSQPRSATSRIDD
jgi:methylmalonyl-CoA/ethylmalonyl-CoA epimerase